MKKQSYNHFWQRIHKTARKKGFPLRVMFELTYRCNFQCPHCYIPENHKQKGELKKEEVFSILDQLRDIGCFYLGFTGGELFMRRDIMEILWYAKRKGFEIILYTNGSWIDKERAGELASLRLNKIDITLPAMSETIFDKVAGVRGSGKRVFEAIKHLHKKGVALGFKTCLLKDNKDEIGWIENFARSLGAPHRLDTKLLPRLDGSKEPYEYRGLNVADHKWPVRNHKGFENCETENERLFKCGVGISQAAITPLGELKMCLMIDYPKYNILDSSLPEAWHRLKELTRDIESNKNQECRRCESEPDCHWCPARGWLENKDFTTCDNL